MNLRNSFNKTKMGKKNLPNFVSLVLMIFSYINNRNFDGSMFKMYYGF